MFSISFDDVSGSITHYALEPSLASALDGFEGTAHISPEYANCIAPVTGMLLFDGEERIEIGRLPLAAYSCHTAKECFRRFPLWFEAPPHVRDESRWRFWRSLIAQGGVT